MFRRSPGRIAQKARREVATELEASRQERAYGSDWDGPDDDFAEKRHVDALVERDDELALAWTIARGEPT